MKEPKIWKWKITGMCSDELGEFVEIKDYLALRDDLEYYQAKLSRLSDLASCSSETLMNGKEINEKLASMNSYIKKTEDYLKSFGFLECSSGNLKWQKDAHNNWRIMLMDKPLLGASLKDRINEVMQIEKLVSQVERECSSALMDLKFN